MRNISALFAGVGPGMKNLSGVRGWLLHMLAACSLLWALPVPSHAVEAGSAEALRAKYAELKPRFAKNPFGQPLVLQSAEASGQLKGDAYALMDYPLSKVSAALRTPEQWCDMLILHLNIKYCRAAEVDGGPGLTVYIGRKADQPLENAYRVDFAYEVAATQPDFFDIRLEADKGPLSTHDYRIMVEAASVDAGHTLLHLTYSYGYGTAGNIAMKGYLATVGADKVGFTVTGEQDGKPVYIGGVRGVVERNTMRYYLAIDTYLKTLDAPPSERLERRLETWFAATERHAQQLHEVERQEYLQMKRNEVKRQRER